MKHSKRASLNKKINKQKSHQQKREKERGTAYN
jgi:hypothetical protein